ncbi:hypothetical protein CR162_17300 [Pseudoroseomonas rhizosphaerae]|uniref:Flagellin n=1 Tax=Teichococcus rhizosphaerae TaxID=1335062 RepID=A0A2C6Z5H2_9PROT|nr:flagellin [Pseudoroseomonas rhizosphaerae]PHK93741.1 hypothetical protein CR162_17300 [Pseudoroseomonas rhizosphaerae]
MLSAVSSPSVGTLSSMQSLRSLNKQVSVLQSQIATGKRVNTAKDNAAIWSLANSLKTDLAMNKEAAMSLSVAASTVAVASSSLEAIVTDLQNMKSAAAQHHTNGTAFATYFDELKQTFDNFEGVLSGATFRGTNLLTSGTAASFTVGYNNGTAITLSVASNNVATGTAYDALGDLFASGAGSTSATDLGIAIDAAINETKSLAVYYGSAANRIDTRTSLIQALNDNLGSAISNLVDTDMDEASARLTALQTQQQLATQLLSITTQNQSTLVQTLFRGF